MYVFPCVVTYVKKTESVRARHDALWLNYSKPFSSVSRDTISRWVKSVLEKAGINTKRFCAHSMRAATTSAAKSTNMSINTIMKLLGGLARALFGSFMTNLWFSQLLTLDGELSYRWLLGPSKGGALMQKTPCIAETTTFSVPQSVWTSLGHPYICFTQLK